MGCVSIPAVLTSNADRDESHTLEMVTAIIVYALALELSLAVMRHARSLEKAFDSTLSWSWAGIVRAD